MGEVILMSHMGNDRQTKEALFNEVKGSLFEFLVASDLAKKSHKEVEFIQQFDKKYLYTLSQQDRMIRGFYPELINFLKRSSLKCSEEIFCFFKNNPLDDVKVIGKLNHHIDYHKFKEGDLIIHSGSKVTPVSLKLSKKNSFVNTKSGGVKSFFIQYFPFLSETIQEDFNDHVEKEFYQMAFELHQIHDLNFSGDFSLWAEEGLPQHPGQLDHDSRLILKKYYKNIAYKMFQILYEASLGDPDSFQKSLLKLLGFSAPEIIQVTCYHHFPVSLDEKVVLHTFEEVEALSRNFQFKKFQQNSSVDILLGEWNLQLRLKPMNKFTAPSMKVNCSVKMK